MKNELFLKNIKTGFRGQGPGIRKEIKNQN